jgi:hypothetical protein
MRHSPFAIRHSPFAIRHSPFAIRHSPFAIRHPPSAIRHSPFAIRHEQVSPADDGTSKVFCIGRGKSHINRWRLIPTLTRSSQGPVQRRIPMRVSQED